ncbi:hypothetical protein NDU88_005977 [Pleurodeles waltl]|uniref:Uncharacterized protein n=1 Tax=Pleurodeles waltl TaxID=8319 RepID=A0AAV7PL40_PLEWA|nr:hypothetical protein NDU88_005977 [Pleurodeles waltl]
MSGHAEYRVQCCPRRPKPQLLESRSGDAVVITWEVRFPTDAEAAVLSWQRVTAMHGFSIIGMLKWEVQELGMQLGSDINIQHYTYDIRIGTDGADAEYRARQD